MKRPALYIAVFLCLGIIFSRHFHIPVVYPWVLSAGALISALLFFKKDKLSHAALFLAIFFFGITYYQNSLILPADHISRYVQDEPQKVLIRGIVVDDPITSQAWYGKKKTSFLLQAEGLGKNRDSPNQGEIAAFGTVPIFSGWKGVGGLIRVNITPVR